MRRPPRPRICSSPCGRRATTPSVSRWRASRRGSIGVVGDSGTGIQEVTTLVHRLGGGISHAIGTGGRDLDAAVGGVTTLQGLGWLAEDDGTRVIVIVSKPSSRDVADRVLAA